MAKNEKLTIVGRIFFLYFHFLFCLKDIIIDVNVEIKIVISIFTIEFFFPVYIGRL